MLAALLASIPGAVGAEAPASWTFEKVWYRAEERPGLLKAYDASGALTVGAAELAFQDEELTVRIPVSAVRKVSTGKMRKDNYNTWVVVEYEKDGATRLAGFMDGKKLGNGRDTVAIYDAIRGAVLAARAAPAEAASGAAPESAAGAAQESAAGAPEGATPPGAAGAVVALEPPERMTWNEFRREVKQGFPGAPNTLLTDPARMGLLLIEAGVKTLATADVDGVALVRKGDESSVFRAGSSRLHGWHNIVMFTGLEPGEYVIRILRATLQNGWIALEMPPHPDLSLRIEAGKVRYLGKIRVKARGRTIREIERIDDPARAAEILTRFADKYQGTPWAALALEQAKSMIPAGSARDK